MTVPVATRMLLAIERTGQIQRLTSFRGLHRAPQHIAVLDGTNRAVHQAGASNPRRVLAAAAAASPETCNIFDQAKQHICGQSALVGLVNHHHTARARGAQQHVSRHPQPTKAKRELCFIPAVFPPQAAQSSTYLGTFKCGLLDGKLAQTMHPNGCHQHPQQNKKNGCHESHIAAACGSRVQQQEHPLLHLQLFSVTIGNPPTTLSTDKATVALTACSGKGVLPAAAGCPQLPL